MKPMKKHTIKQAGTLRSLLLLFGLALGSGLSAQDAAAVLDAVRRQHAPDRRVAVFEIEAERINDTLHILKGKCDDPEAIEALRAAFRGAGIRVRRLCESAARRLAEREERGSRHALVDQSADGSGPRGRNEHASHHGHAAARTRTVRQLVSRADARRLHRLDQRGLDRAEDSRGNETLALGRPLRLHGLHGIRLRRAGPPLGHGVRSGARLGSRSRYRSQKRRKFASVRLPDGRSAMFFAARSKTSKRGPLVRSIRTGWNGRRGR